MAMRNAKAKSANPQAAPPGVAQGLRLEWISAGDLAANPANWRRHPDRQQAAIAASLLELGWLKPVTYNEQTRRLVDGHARVGQVKPTDVIPVWVVSLTAEQEAKALLLLDSITGMAEADQESLQRLMASVELLGDLHAVTDDLEALMAARDVLGDGEAPAKDGKKAKRQAKSETSGEGDGGDGGGPLASYQVVASCQDEADQERVYNLLKENDVECRVSTLY